MSSKTKSIQNASNKANLNSPNQTLYCTNLPDKLLKEDLRRLLYLLFSAYGPVLDVVALKTPKMRGQAHIVFKDIQASTQALRALQGFNFFGKEMRVSYAKGKSSILSKLEGSYHATSAPVHLTGVQQSIFNAPPNSSAITTTTTGFSPPNQTSEPSDTKGKLAGKKRQREEASDEEGVPMDEGDDGDAPMEDSSSDED